MNGTTPENAFWDGTRVVIQILSLNFRSQSLSLNNESELDGVSGRLSPFLAVLMLTVGL